MTLTPEYWDQRYDEGNTGWDTGSITPPLKNYFDQLTNKDAAILIPGAGNAYEAEYLVRNGFCNITILDFAPGLVNKLKSHFASYTGINLSISNEDFFEHQGQYDLIIEQTFFCALKPEQRADYVKKMHDLLKPGGKVAGVLFGVQFEKEGPPFGGTKEQYMPLFQKHFKIETFETCYNSLPPRQGKELFIKVRRK